MAQLTSISRSERARSSSSNRDDWTLPSVDSMHSGTSASYIDGSIDNPRYMLDCDQEMILKNEDIFKLLFILGVGKHFVF